MLRIWLCCILLLFPALAQAADIGSKHTITIGKEERVYYLYDVPGGAERGGHAHKELQQLIIAMSGSFDVVLDDGTEKKRIHLNRSYYGLYVPTMLWRELDNFSSGAVCMVLASNHYDEKDYYREYDEYLKAVNNQQ